MRRMLIYKNKIFCFKMKIVALLMIILIWLMTLGARGGIYNESVSRSLNDDESLNANFIYSPLLPHIGQEVKFYNLSVKDTDELIWNFGDGQISKQPNPSHKYSFPSVYYVTLRLKQRKTNYPNLQINNCKKEGRTKLS